MSSEPDQPGKKEFFQHLVTGFTVGAAVLYVVGMLVTNEYLFSLGFTDFNLIRPKSIITGTWVVLLMFACCGPAISLDRLKDEKIGKKRLAEEIFASYAIAMGLGIVFFPVLVSHWSAPVAKAFLLLPLMLAFGPLLHTSIVFLIHRGVRPWPPYTRHVGTLAAMVLSPLMATVLIALYIYPEVHPVLGGGRPLPAKLVLTTEGVAAWEQISGSTLKGRDSVATNLEILYDNDSHIVVRLKNFNPETGSVAVIDRKVVVAVLPGPTGWGR